MKQVVGDKVERARRSRWVTLAGMAVGLFVFALYVATLTPTILYYTDTMKDSAVLPTIGSWRVETCSTT